VATVVVSAARLVSVTSVEPVAIAWATVKATAPVAGSRLVACKKAVPEFESGGMAARGFVGRAVSAVSCHKVYHKGLLAQQTLELHPAASQVVLLTETCILLKVECRSLYSLSAAWVAMVPLSEVVREASQESQKLALHQEEQRQEKQRLCAAMPAAVPS
jgi:hypothetical protein